MLPVLAAALATERLSSMRRAHGVVGQLAEIQRCTQAQTRKSAPYFFRQLLLQVSLQQERDCWGRPAKKVRQLDTTIAGAGPRLNLRKLLNAQHSK